MSEDANPPEFFLDGPPEHDALLHRTVRTVRKRGNRSARMRLGLVMAGAVLAAAAFTGTGLALGQHAAPSVTVVATAPGSPARVGVVLSAYEGGSSLALTASGLPQGSTCRLVLIGRDGRRMPLGGWRVGTQSASWPMRESTWLPPDAIAGIDVQVGDGTVLHGSAS